MAASRLRFGASLALAAVWGLLAAASFPGCALQRAYVRRGVLLDSIAVRTDRVERHQLEWEEYVRAVRADMLTEIQAVQTSLAQLEARTIDQDERLARIGRRLGVWHEAVVAPTDTALGADSIRVRPDSALPAVDPDELYATAYLDFTRGQYKVAIAGFKQYLQMFPNSDLSDNAQYWIGECYHSMGELNKAEVEFGRVLAEHPDGNKVPAAEYKLGLVYQAAGRYGAARQQFLKVIEKYPGTPEAKLAQDRVSPEQE
ncbi:MAG: tol-pal system protein YbgF [candidate division WOR-3 bacterium]|nr:MAG: tol-pal system protein YbgF [candidate division WOR-3 bacterium]